MVHLSETAWFESVCGLCVYLFLILNDFSQPQALGSHFSTLCFYELGCPPPVFFLKNSIYKVPYIRIPYKW